MGVPTLPLANYPVFNFGQLPADAQLTAAIAPYYLDWLAHPDYDDYWKQWSIEENFSKITVPMLQVGGWYDIFLAGTLRNYMGGKAHGATEAARTQQHLLMQIGGHAGFGPAYRRRGLRSACARERVHRRDPRLVRLPF